MAVAAWPDRASALIRRAVLAPSSHNTQPWRFRISAQAIDLYADRSRALPVNDPADRELTISCGCALFNLQLAAAAEGLPARVELLPDAGQPDWLAHVELSGREHPDSELAGLAAAIEQRRTCRQPFAPHCPDRSRVERLLHAVEAEGVRAQEVTDDGMRRQLADLVAEGGCPSVGRSGLATGTGGLAASAPTRRWTDGPGAGRPPCPPGHPQFQPGAASGPA